MRNAPNRLAVWIVNCAIYSRTMLIPYANSEFIYLYLFTSTHSASQQRRGNSFERPEGRLSKQTGAPGFMTKRTSAARNQPQSASSAHKKKTNPTGTLSTAALGEVHNSCDGQLERQVAYIAWISFPLLSFLTWSERWEDAVHHCLGAQREPRPPHLR